MSRLLFLALLVVAGWYGNSLYRQGELTTVRDFLDRLGVGGQEKCITKSGQVFYGEVPQGVVCETVAPIEGSLTVVAEFPGTDGSNHDPGGFRCDGRQHCSQMNSRAEAEFFINNCPNTKMDGDRDGIPCEGDTRF